MYPAARFGRMYVQQGRALAEAGPSYGQATPDQRAWRAANNYYGVGAYSAGKNFRKFSQSVGLAKAGKRLVRGATSAALGFIGQGAYGNSLMAGGASTPEVPRVISDADETGAITISRREYISDVFAPGVTGAATIPAFANTQFPLNPGLEASFPWLSQIAQNYEEYQFEQLIFHFRSTITDIGSSTTGQCGTIIMATNYNAAAPEFGDKNAMQAYDGAMSCKTTEAMTHGVECDTRKRAGADSLYVRSAPVPLGQDLKTYDHGSFQFALANLPVAYAGQAIGELWVSYTVKLAKPKFAVSRGSAIERDIFVSGGGESATSTFGTPALILQGQQNGLGCTLLTTVANELTLTFPPEYAGTVEVILLIEGGASTNASAFDIPDVFGNVALINDIYSASGSTPADGDGPFAYTWSRQAGGTTGATTNSWIHIVHVRVSPSTAGASNRLRLNTRMTSGGTQASLDVHEYNAAFSTRALGIGPIGARSDAPILINAGGQQVVPS